MCFANTDNYPIQPQKNVKWPFLSIQAWPFPFLKNFLYLLINGSGFNDKVVKSHVSRSIKPPFAGIGTVETYFDCVDLT